LVTMCRCRDCVGAPKLTPPTSIQRCRTSAQGVAPVLNRKRPKEKPLMNKNTETTATKPASFPNGPEAFRDMAEKGATQAKKTYENMTAASTEAADLIKNSYWTAVKDVEDYNSKFARANTNAAFDFVQKMSGVKSPTAFIELWTEHARQQVETLTEQSKQLAALAQKVTRATAELLKTGIANPFNRAA
jgi:phasin